MDCETACRLISEGLDGRLDENDRRALAAHLSDCTDCAEVARRFAGLADILSEYDAPGAPADLKNRIVAEAGFGPSASIARRSTAIRWGIGALAAAASLLVAVAVWRAAGPAEEVVADGAEAEILYLAPEVPAEFARACAVILPRADDAASRFGSRVAADLPRAGERVAAGAAGLPERAGRLSGRILEGVTPRVMEGAGRAFRIMTIFGFEEPEENGASEAPRARAGEGNEFRAAGRRVVVVNGAVLGRINRMWDEC